MEKEFLLEGYVTTDVELSEDLITDLFIEFVESNNWLLGGGIHYNDSKKAFEVSIGVIVEEEQTYDSFYEKYNGFMSSSYWKYDGEIKEVIDGYYINRDGTRGKHVLDDMN